MSNDSAQEKTEEASQQKLRKSRQEGQVARSRDWSTTLSLLITLLILKLCAGWFFEGLQEAFRLSYLDLAHTEMSLDDLDLILTRNLLLFVQLLSPLLITTVLVPLFALLPGGWVFAAKNFSFRGSKLDPIAGLKRMVSLQNWSELLKSLAKIAVLALFAGYLSLSRVPQLIALQRSDIHSAIAAALNLALDTALLLMGVFLLFSLIDIPLQRFFFLKKQRMTKQERKEEHKNQEGRPEVKARIRQVQRQMLHRQISRVIKNADVVIVNPSHYAVAVRYDSKRAQAPYVIAKGTDETALYIRQLAASHALDVLEVPPLARAIYYTTQVNQQIPAVLYKAVAQVLTYVLQLKAWRQGKRRRPELAANLPIPETLANRGLK